MKWVQLGSAALLVFSLCAARANSIFDNNSIYEVVVQDATSGTDLAPGIYRINKKTGESELLISGKVNGANRARKGVLWFSKLSARTTQDALSLVDGRLTFFNQNSRPNDGKSKKSAKSAQTFLTIGGKGGIPVLDILSGRQVEIGKVEDLDDISLLVSPLIYPDRVARGFEVILVSLRVPSTLGSGVTLALLLNGSSASETPAIEGGRAYLLAHDYLDERQLHRLLLNDDLAKRQPVVYAPLTIEATLAQLSQTDVEVPSFKKWRQQLATYLKFIRTGGAEKLQENEFTLLKLGLPTFDLLTNRPVAPRMPIDVIKNSAGTPLFGQVFDPFTGQFSILDAKTKRGYTVAGDGTVYVPRSSISEFRIAGGGVQISASGKPAIIPVTVITNLESLGNGSEVTNEKIETLESTDPVSAFIDHLGKIRLLVNGSQVLDLNSTNEAVVKPGDRVALYQIPEYQSTGAQNQRSVLRNYFLIHQSAKSKNMILRGLVTEILGDSPEKLVYQRLIYQGPSMTTAEAILRTHRLQDGDVLFDYVSPIKGAGRYLNEKGSDGKLISVRQKTVPYLRVMAGWNAPIGYRAASDQIRYLTTVFERQITPGLTYKMFNPEGLTVNSAQAPSGFYLDLRSKEQGEAKESFLRGRPLLAKKLGADNVLVDYTFDRVKVEPSAGGSGAPTASPTVVSLFPFSSEPYLKPRKKSKKDEQGVKQPKQVEGQFNIGLATHLDYGGDNIQQMMTNISINLPFESLSSIKILRPEKQGKSKFHALMFFRALSDIPGSKDGVGVFTVHTRYVHSGTGYKTMLEVTAPVMIHKGNVDPKDIPIFVREDSGGNLYWIADPSVPADSPKASFRKLANPGEVVSGRSGNLLTLKESKTVKETTSNAYTSYIGSVGGEWTVKHKYELERRVSGAKEIIDLDEQMTSKSKSKDKSKDKSVEEDEEVKRAEKAARAEAIAEKQLFDGFNKYLDRIAIEKGDGARKVEVILVEKSMKPKFRGALLKKLITDVTGEFWINNNKLEFAYADQTLDDIEIAEEFEAYEDADKSESRVLMVEPEILRDPKVKARERTQAKKEVTAADSDTAEDSAYASADYEGMAYYNYSRRKERTKPVFVNDKPDEEGDFNVILATGGTAKTIRGFKKSKPKLGNVHTIVLATPEEWREIEERNLESLNAGVFDRYSFNFDYLTSAWTVWPPATQRASEDIKSLSKVPYNSEEMRVFPTLDRILQDAATGESRGQQKIVIVPPEILPIINKIILTRWATGDHESATPWHFTEKNLALFRLSAREISQDSLKENYQAMAGAASVRNPVLLGDLETVLRIGRPINAKGRNFTLKDPFRSTKDLLVDGLNDQAAGAKPQEQSSPEVQPPPNLSEEDSEALENMQTELEELEEALEDRKASYAHIDRSDYDSVEEFQMARSELRAELESIKGNMGRLSEQIAELTGESKQGDSGNQGNPKYPHMVWWIASEGKPIQPKKGKNWSVGAEANRQISTVLIGTEDQLDQVKSSLTIEEKFFDFDQNFEVIRLEPPSEETKFKLVQQLLGRPEVTSLQLEYKIPGDLQKDAKSQLIYQFINRVDQLAYDQKMEKTTAFVKAFIALRLSLVEDVDLRRSRLIDQKYIERLFTKVFPMPLNPEILEPTDWLRRVGNVEEAVRDLQKTGYEGSQDLKRRFFETMLSQTRPTDPSRPIPNSQILFGTTSTGKTFLLKTFFKMAGLVEYNPHRVNNEDADYFLFSVGDITEKKTDEPNKMSIAEWIANVLDFMAQRKGARGHIAIDDFHKAPSSEVRSQVFRFIQGILDAKNGMYLVRTKDGKTREIPVQNLNIYMTLNPTSNESVRRKYVVPNQRYSATELLKKEVLAALSDEAFSPEESELARWADIVPLDQFPRSAKVPELGRRVRENSRSSRHMVMVDPLVINSLVEKFSGANARELLAPAAAALTAIPPSAREARLYTVTLKAPGRSIGSDWDEYDGRGSVRIDAARINSGEIRNVVRDLVQVDPVTIEEPRSVLRFISFLVQNFRLQVMNFLTVEAHMTDVIRLDRPGFANLIKTNFMVGMTSHVMKNPTLPVRELDIRPEQLAFYNRSEQEDFYRLLKAAAESKEYFPKGLTYKEPGAAFGLNEFTVGGISHSDSTRTRKTVILETLKDLNRIMGRAAVLYLRLNSKEEMRDLSIWNDQHVRDWFNRLSESNPEAEFKGVMRELLVRFLQFQVEFNSPELANSSVDELTSLTLYDDVRLFGYLIDKSLTRLPWGNIAKLVYDIVDQSGDYSLGTKTAFKEYVGVHSISPFAVSTPEFLSEMLQVGVEQMARGKNVDQFVDGLDKRFHGICEEFLAGAN